MNEKWKNIGMALVNGGLSFLIAHIAIPMLCVGWPDLLWMSLRLLLPVLPAMWLVCEPGHVWLGLPVQMTLLGIFSRFVAALHGISFGGLGGFEYLPILILWPLVITAVQFVVFWSRKRGMGA